MSQINNKYKHGYSLRLMSQDLSNLDSEPLVLESFQAPVIQNELTKEEMYPVAVHFIKDNLTGAGSLAQNWLPEDKASLRERLENEFILILYRNSHNSNSVRLSIRQLGNLYNELYISPNRVEHFFDLSQELLVCKVAKNDFQELSHARNIPNNSLLVVSNGQVRVHLAVEYD